MLGVIKGRYICTAFAAFNNDQLKLTPSNYMQEQESAGKILNVFSALQLENCTHSVHWKQRFCLGHYQFSWLVKTAYSSCNGRQVSAKEAKVRILATAAPFDAHLSQISFS